MLIKAGWAMGVGAVLLLPLVGSLLNQGQTKTSTASSPSVSQQSPSSLPSGTEWRDKTTAAAPSSGSAQPDDVDLIAKKYGGTVVSTGSAHDLQQRPPGRSAVGQFGPRDIDHTVRPATRGGRSVERLPPIGKEVVFAEPAVRPTTGYEWQTPLTDAGLGELSVTNGTGKDGVAVLFERLSEDSVRARRAVYVRARENARLLGIASGTYTLRFMLGVDWDDPGRVFRRDVECHAFVDALDFAETTTGDKVVYSEQSVTLHKVINGNARSTTVRPAMVRFDELLRIQQP